MFNSTLNVNALFISYVDYVFENCSGSKIKVYEPITKHWFNLLKKVKTSSIYFSNIFLRELTLILV